MFFRLLLESFRRQRRRKLLAGAAILLGTTAVTAMLAIATTIGDRIHQELAVYGANLIMTPAADTLAVKIGGVDLHPATGNAFLHESDLTKLRTIFWANNITGVSPDLYFNGVVQLLSKPESAVPVNVSGFWFAQRFGSAKTGAPQLHPWWKLQGSWPSPLPTGTSDVMDAVIGDRLAKRLGVRLGDLVDFYTPAADRAHIANRLSVRGIVSTGSNLDTGVILPLSTAQRLNNTPDAVSRVEISARTRPEDAFARKDPDSLPAKQREIWYCRPYANSIAYQIHEAIPSARVTQLRQVEQSEGKVLSRISGLMWLVSAAALLAAAFAVSAAMATAILERRAEIGLMRSLGASRASIATLFYVESALLALVAGAGGYLLGSALAAFLGARIFAPTAASLPAAASAPNLHAAAHLVLSAFNPVLLPVVLAVALLVALAGSTPSIRSALRLDPSHVLRSDA